VTRIRSVLNPVDQRLRMLDPNAQRKPFRFQGDLHLLEHLENVSRGMPGRQHDCVRFERTPV
jgi:hypothetical protein